MSGDSSINAHIPGYIRNQPWFYREGEKNGDYLVHHRRARRDGESGDNSEARVGVGIRDEFEKVQVVKSVRRGGDRCGNCGSAGHSRRDCLERAGVLGRREGPEVIAVRREASGAVNWDARKDRWYGYGGKEYDEVLKKWQAGSEETQEEEEWWDTDEEVELMKLGLYKDAEGLIRVDEPGSGKLQRASVRLREDRAAYLSDLNSAETNYDPKSRLYKTGSLGSVDEESKMFRRHLTGEGKALDELSRFTRAHAKKQGIRDEIEDDAKVKHVLVANPTRYEQMLREEREKPPRKVAKITDLHAKKSSGTTQSAKTRQELMDLYG